MSKVYISAVILSVIVTLASLAICMVGIVMQDPGILRLGGILLAVGFVTVIVIMIAFKKPDPSAG